MQELEKYILNRLLRHRMIGKKYTPIEHVISGLPDDRKRKADIKSTIKNLRSKGWVQLHKKNTCISLVPNRKRISDVKKFIGFKSLFSLLF